MGVGPIAGTGGEGEMCYTMYDLHQKEDRL